MNPCVTGTKDGMLLPNAEASLTVRLDTSRFVGRKTVGLTLTTKRGEITQEFGFTITGISDRSP